MKILQIGKFYPPIYGGIESVMFDLTEGLNDAEIQCDVICSNDKNKYEVSQFGKYRVFRTALLTRLFSTSVTPQMFFKLRKIIGDYDIIQVHLPDPMVTLILWLIKPKAKIVLYWHSDIIKQEKLLKIYEPLQNWLIKRADAIIGATKAHIEESDYSYLFKNKAYIIPYGINKQVANIEKVDEIKSNYLNKKIIFSMGRLVYYKGFEYLVDSAKFLPDDYIILIGGTGNLNDSLNSQISSQKLDDKVKLLGRIEGDNLWDYFQACDLFCLPSIFRSEMFGIVQIEAMMFGKPVISTKIKRSGVPLVNDDNKTGYCVVPKSSKELADAILKLMSDQKQYDTFSKNAVKRFENNFSRERMVEKHIKLYKDIFE